MEKPKTQSLDHYWQIWQAHEFGKLSDSKQTAYKGAYKKLGKLVYMDIDKITVDDLKNAVSK